MTFRKESPGQSWAWAASLLFFLASVTAQSNAKQQQQSPQVQYPSHQQQYPKQQYPQQQYPTQQQQYPAQQQQYPAQQQQYPAQQQYPTQQYPTQQQYPQQQQYQYPVQLYSDSNWNKYQQRLPAPEQDPWAAEVDRIISRGVLQLSLSLAAAVEQDTDRSGLSGNVVLSPVNVAAALALVLAGSNGTTFQEIAKVLGIATGVDVLQNRELVHKEFGRFLTQLETQAAVVRTDRAVPSIANVSANQVVFANGLFVQRDYSIQPYFAQIAQSYRSEVIPVEFYRDPGRTKETINSWFAERTRGRIKAVLAEAPPADTRLMIASALFFNGAWETPFPLEATMIRPFNAYSSNGTKELFAVRMMTNNLDLRYVADRALGCRMLELPYRGREVSMFLMLPDAQGMDKLRQLEARLTPDVMEGLIAAMKEAPVIYSVPRMKLERSISLRTALETLGVRSLFDSRLADLSHLADPVGPASSTPAASGATRPTTPATPSPTTSPSSSTTPSSSAANPTPAPMSTSTPVTPRSSRPTGESNAIAPNSPLFFADRMSNLAEANNSESGTLSERWGAPAAKLYADDVLHKVEVEVTETGTVASAATAITISRDGSNHVMRFNRPFVFFIRHNPTGLVLFYGSVVRPQPEWIVAGVDPYLLGPSAASSHRVPPPRPPQQHQQQARQQQAQQQPPRRVQPQG